MIKIIAMHLPQFHEVKENSEWWGEGYTEWVAVKKAKSLFDKHNQPKVPLDNNYYDLLNKTTMLWQTAIAKKYGVYGFSYYHYWFKDGRQILEKPVDNLLKWKDIDMPFCLTWANPTWARTWSAVKNSEFWSSKFESSNSPKNGILMEQKYGAKEDWIAHINYLIPFFKDKRYIRYDDKPVFMIYSPELIYCLPDMLECWREELKKEGIKDIYVIGTLMTSMVNDNIDVDAWAMHLPISLENHEKKLASGLRVMDYSEYWKKVISVNWDEKSNKDIFLLPMVSYDETPRRGNNSFILTDDSPKIFKNFFPKMLSKENESGKEFIFLNAWNEWGEGMYLEPDTTNGYGYLEAVKTAIDGLDTKLIKNTVDDNYVKDDYLEKYNSLKKVYLRDRFIINILQDWFKLKIRNIDIDGYLLKNGYKNIAIYGLGRIGKLLIDELLESDIKISYVVDKKTNLCYRGYQSVSLLDDLPKVDIIIVTPIYEYSIIKKYINNYSKCRTISFAHIIDELSE